MEDTYMVFCSDDKLQQDIKKFIAIEALLSSVVAFDSS